MAETAIPAPSEAARPVLAIATRDVSNVSETFVRRHVEHLFGGRTVLISLRPGQSAWPDKPSLSCPAVPTLPPPGSLRARFGAGRRARLRAGRDAAVREFLGEMGATHVLAEFGYIGIEVAGAVRETGLPFACYFRGADASSHLRRPGYATRLAEMMPQLSGVIAVSRFLLDTLAAHGVSHPRSAVIPSGTDTALFRPGETDPDMVLSVGRMVAKKAPQKVISAFAAVAADRPGLRLEFIGDGPELAASRRLARKLGLGARVVFHGARDHAFVRDRMARAGVVCQAFETARDGDTEGMPGVIQEAMACGRAIVTTRHAGVPEHVEDGRTGLLVEEGDTEGMAAALRRVIAEPGLAVQMGAAARAHAEAELDYRDLYRRTEAFLLGGADAG